LPISSYVRDGRVIVCQGCHASAPPAYHGPPDRPSSEERARENWNRRTAPPIPTGGGEPSKNGYTYDPDHYWSPAQLRRWADRESCRVGGDAETARYLCRAADRIEALNAPSPATGAPPPLTVQAGFLPGSENHAEAVKFLAGGVETDWEHWCRWLIEKANDRGLTDAEKVSIIAHLPMDAPSPPPAAGVTKEQIEELLGKLLSVPGPVRATIFGQDDAADAILALFQGAGR